MVRALLHASPRKHPAHEVVYFDRAHRCLLLACFDMSVPLIRRKIWQNRKSFAGILRTDPGAQPVASTQYPRHLPVLPATRNKATCVNREANGFSTHWYNVHVQTFLRLRLKYTWYCLNSTSSEFRARCNAAACSKRALR